VATAGAQSESVRGYTVRVPTRQFEHYMNEHCRAWTYNCKQLQSITVDFADIIVLAFVLLEVEVLVCLILYAILLERLTYCRNAVSAY